MRALLCIFFLLFLTTGCQKEESVSLEIDSRIKQVVFLSDETNIANLQIEAPYYDAIIELRQQFPDDFKNMKTILPREASEHFDTFKIEECPALIVLYNEKVIAKVTGENTKEDILQPITEALQD